ncbi:hypothetical protein Btru_055553 [Bulinus truncatus]|nr:hypothetical protein Btru_055553 [Bulinus truncatus]
MKTIKIETLHLFTLELLLRILGPMMWALDDINSRHEKTETSVGDSTTESTNTGKCHFSSALDQTETDISNHSAKGFSKIRNMDILSRSNYSADNLSMSNYSTDNLAMSNYSTDNLLIGFISSSNVSTSSLIFNEPITFNKKSWPFFYDVLLSTVGGVGKSTLTSPVHSQLMFNGSLRKRSMQATSTSPATVTPPHSVRSINIRTKHFLLNRSSDVLYDAVTSDQVSLSDETSPAQSDHTPHPNLRQSEMPGFNWNPVTDDRVSEDVPVRTLHIGGLFELSSRDGPNGYSELDAALLAIDHINDKNIIPGYKLKLLYNDSKSNDIFQQSNDISQQSNDISQQSNDIFHQSDDIFQQSNDISQQSNDIFQQSNDISQQTNDISQQSNDISQQSNDISQQTKRLKSIEKQEYKHDYNILFRTAKKTS